MRIKCHLAMTLLLVATLFGTSIMSVSATEVNAYAESSIDKCEEILAFVENNFDTFVDEYNKTVEDEERLNATSIDHSLIYLKMIHTGCISTLTEITDMPL